MGMKVRLYICVCGFFKLDAAGFHYSLIRSEDLSGVYVSSGHLALTKL